MKTLRSVVMTLAFSILYSSSALCFEVFFSDANVVTIENAGAVTVSVVRAGSGEGICSAELKTVEETAFTNWDFIAVTGRVEFALGQTLIQKVIPLITDSVPEPSKRFLVVLGQFSNCVPGELTNSTIIVQDAQTEETMAQDFESGLPPGWVVTTNADPNGYWRFDCLANWENMTGGEGGFAMADNCDYIEPMDTELRTPSFPVAVTSITYLVFKTDYLSGGSDIADVDVNSLDSGGPWINLWKKYGKDYPGPVTEIINLTPIIKGASNVVVRFHYYNATNEWYWQIDDVAILVEPDSNTNGLPDWWETIYFGNLTNLNPLADSDGDGASNEDEFIAGTNPRDKGSCFKMEELRQSNDTSRLRFPTELGHFYNLYSCTNLLNGSWTNRITRLYGAGGATNLNLSAAGTNVFYRGAVRRW